MTYMIYMFIYLLYIQKKKMIENDVNYILIDNDTLFICTRDTTQHRRLAIGKIKVVCLG